MISYVFTSLRLFWIPLSLSHHHPFWFLNAFYPFHSSFENSKKWIIYRNRVINSVCFKVYGLHVFATIDFVVIQLIYVRNHEPQQWYDIVHFEHKFSCLCFLASPKGLLPMEIVFFTYKLMIFLLISQCGTTPLNNPQQYIQQRVAFDQNLFYSTFGDNWQTKAFLGECLLSFMTWDAL